LGKATDTTIDSLEERVARLSVSIGGRTAAALTTSDRELILADAHDEIVGDLVGRGHALHEAAMIADDIIDGARKLAAELIAHGYKP
jgi:hypothetical protein